jgi:hypothetical protein
MRRGGLFAAVAVLVAATPTGAQAADTLNATCANLQTQLNAVNETDDVVVLSGVCTSQFTLPDLGTAPANYIRWTLRGDPSNGEDGFDGSTLPGRMLTGNNVHFVEIRDLLFRDGTQTGNGGALSVAGESGVGLRGSRFFNNHATGRGGAVYFGFSALVGQIGGFGISGNTFGSTTSPAEGNSADLAGGAVSVQTPGQTSNSGINTSTFANNVSGTTGGAFDYELAPAGVENFSLNFNTIVSNKARASGGGGHIVVHDASFLGIDQNLFEGNSVEPGAAPPAASHFGGGLFVESGESNPRLRNNTFTGNSVKTFANATGYGGGGFAVHTVDGSVLSQLETFTGNSLPAAPAGGESEGGGIYASLSGIDPNRNFHQWLGAVAGNSVGAGGEGGGIYFGNENPANLELSDTTVAGNAVGAGGSRPGLSGNGVDHLQLHNTIVWNPALPDIGGFATNDVLYSDACLVAGTPFPGTGNMCADPYLANAAGGNIHQTLISPTVDKGNDALFLAEEEGPTEDFEGDPRPTDGDGDGHTVDIGADEGPAFVAQVPPTPQCADGKDNDADGATDLQDPGCKSAADTNEGDESVRDLVLCGRRTISLVRADARGRKAVLSGVVATSVAGKPVSIFATYRKGKRTKLTKIASVRPNSAGQFTATVKGPPRRLFAKARFQARVGSARSVSLKLPQSLASSSVKTSGGQIVVRGKVQRNLLGKKRNAVVVKRIVCGRYAKVGSARPDKRGNYVVRFNAPALATAALYRAESKVLARPKSKRYVTQFARAIGITLTGQSG